jgi:hypothetical protein
MLSGPRSGASHQILRLSMLSINAANRTTVQMSVQCGSFRFFFRLAEDLHRTPPPAVGIPRALSPSAMARNDVAPAACSSVASPAVSCCVSAIAAELDAPALGSREASTCLAF